MESGIQKVVVIRQPHGQPVGLRFPAGGQARDGVRWVRAVLIGPTVVPGRTASFRPNPQGDWDSSWVVLFSVTQGGLYALVVQGFDGENGLPVGLPDVTTVKVHGTWAAPTFAHPPSDPYTLEGIEPDYFLPYGGTDSAVGTNDVTVGARYSDNADWDPVYEMWWAEFSDLKRTHPGGPHDLTVRNASGGMATYKIYLP